MATDLRDELLPCPFCGRQPVMEPWHGGGPMKRRIGCDSETYDECAVGPSVVGNTPRQAIERWNRRAPAKEAGRG